MSRGLETRAFQNKSLRVVQKVFKLLLGVEDIKFFVVQSQIFVGPETFSEVLSFEFVGNGAIILVVGHVV